MTRFGFFFNILKTDSVKFHKSFRKDEMFYVDSLSKLKIDKFPFLRLSCLILFVTAVFFVIISRLIYLQIVKHDEYTKIADGNRIFSKRIIALRGIITDRFGTELVLNRPKFLIKNQGKNVAISEKEALKIAADDPIEYSKIEIIGERKYLRGEEFAHLIGYLGEINEKELKVLKKQGYVQGDLIGRSGVEAQYESVLRGENGEEYYEINSSGHIVDSLGLKEATPGENVKLTIDADLQKTAFDALREAVSDKRYTGGQQIKGSVVVTDIKSGEVLAMVSLPTYNPAKPEKYIHDDKNFPLMDRSISATYPPGSTFKLVVATAGLESGRITKNSLFDDTGVIKIGQWEFPTWSSIRDGMMNIVTGLRRSNDIYFYRASEKIGLEKILEYAKRFNLGEKMGIDLPAEASGNLPSDSWKFQVTGEHWYLGDTYHLAIGQGFILTTPLQVNMWTNAIASRGKLYKPHVVLGMQNANLKMENDNIKLKITDIRKNPLEIRENPGVSSQNGDYLIRDLNLKKETLDLIWKGMREACQTGGTGWPFFDFKISVACKTGTAEHLEGEATHAWFTAFAPFDKPEIAVTVLIENGGQGSDVAAPVAKKILSKYFNVK